MPVVSDCGSAYEAGSLAERSVPRTKADGVVWLQWLVPPMNAIRTATQRGSRELRSRCSFVLCCYDYTNENREPWGISNFEAAQLCGVRQ